MSIDSQGPKGMDRPRRPSFIRRHRAWLIAAVVLAGLGAGVSLFSAGMSDRSLRLSSASLRIGEVEHAVFHDDIPLSGKVAAHDTVLLAALEGGRVDQVLVEPGDEVKKGQALVMLSNADLSLDVLEREARLIESVTQLQSYQTSLEQARLSNEKALAEIDYNIQRLKRSAERRTTLAANGAEPVELKDQVDDELAFAQRSRAIQAEGNQTQDTLRRRQLPQIEDQAAKLQKDVVITRGMLDNLTVRAPVDGRLTALNAKVGETHNRGESFGEITLNTGFKLNAAVDEFYLGRLRTGQAASVQVDGKSYRLRVVRIYPQVSNGTFGVDLDFTDAAPPGLLTGQTVRGKLSLGADVVTTVLPAGAFLERTGGDWVFVLAPDGRSAVRRTVKTGRRNSDQVEIVGGLKPGDRVIISDYAGLERVQRIDLTK